MLYSMTGYGRATSTFQNKSISIEIKSLNSKFTDVRLRLPQNFKEKEIELRRMIQEELERGKLEFSLDISSLSMEEADGVINEPLFTAYFNNLTRLSHKLGFSTDDIMQTIVRLPNVVASQDGEIEEGLWNAIMQTYQEAKKAFMAFRLKEGQSTQDDLMSRVLNIQDLLSRVAPFEAERVEKIRNRMRQNLEEFMARENVDQNRYEQEVIFYLEKIDINEEKVRLSQHCQYFIEELKSTQVLAKGRKLGFISQEMGREINTLGAKAYSPDIQRLVVTMKDELEKIKEQVANLV